MTGSAARHWEGPGVIAALETAGYRAIAMDCRGHGQSGKPHDVNQYGLEMVRDVIRLLDHLHIDRAHVVGYSMGGIIANQLLVRYPDRLRTLTLLGAGWQGEDMTAITAQMNALADGFAKRDASWLVGAVTGGQNADQFTYSGGLQYVIDANLTAEAVYERTNAIPDFPRARSNRRAAAAAARHV